MSLHYLGKHEPGNCVFSVHHRHVFTHILLENVSGSEQNRSVIANVQTDYLWPSRMHAATHILQEKTHACGILKRQNFWVHVSLGSAETLVRRGGIINHHSIAYYLSNISAKNYQNRLMWVESIVVCNISVVFLRRSVVGWVNCLCGAGSHPCFKCKTASSAMSATKCCAARDCGRFYHAACIDGETCPLHSCATCSARHVSTKVSSSAIPELISCKYPCCVISVATSVVAFCSQLKMKY